MVHSSISSFGRIMGWTWYVHNIACKSTFNYSYQSFIGQASDDANNDVKSSPSSPLLILSASSPDEVGLPKWMLRNDDRDPETSSKSSTLRWNPPSIFFWKLGMRWLSSRMAVWLRSQLGSHQPKQTSIMMNVLALQVLNFILTEPIEFTI